MSPTTIFVENFYKLLKIHDKFNCLVNFRSITERFIQQIARKAISRELRRFKNSDGKGIFKNFDFCRKSVTKSTGLGLDPETAPGLKIQY